MIKVLFNYLATLVQQQQQMLVLLQLFSKTQDVKTEDWLDNVDVKRLLKISESTLYRLRKAEHVSCKKVGRKWYYDKTALLNLLK